MRITAGSLGQCYTPAPLPSRACWRCFFWKWRRKTTKPSAKRPKMRAYSSGSGMTWLLTTTRNPLVFAAKKPPENLLKVPAWKSPMGLFKMPEPAQPKTVRWNRTNCSRRHESPSYLHRHSHSSKDWPWFGCRWQ